jgi:hypothetical protein
VARAVGSVALSAVAVLCKEQGGLAPFVVVAATALHYLLHRLRRRPSAAQRLAEVGGGEVGGGGPGAGVARSGPTPRLRVTTASVGPFVVLTLGGLLLVTARFALFGGGFPQFSTTRQVQPRAE